MEIVQNNALITVNATMVFQLVSFLILVYILHRLMIKPLRATMEERDNYLDRLEAEIGEGEVKLEAFEAELAAKKKEFFSESSHLRKQLMEEASAAGAEIVSEARSKITGQLHDATRESQIEAKEIRKEFDTLAGQLATEIIDKVLDRRAA